VFISLFGLQAPLLAQNAPQLPTEAPAGFDTPTLVQSPGSKSSSNGIAEPPGDTFGLDQRIYETAHDVNSGLGLGMAQSGHPKPARAEAQLSRC